MKTEKQKKLCIIITTNQHFLKLNDRNSNYLYQNEEDTVLLPF